MRRSSAARPPSHPEPEGEPRYRCRSRAGAHGPTDGAPTARPRWRSGHVHSDGRRSSRRRPTSPTTWHCVVGTCGGCKTASRSWGCHLQERASRRCCPRSTPSSPHLQYWLGSEAYRLTPAGGTKWAGRRSFASRCASLARTRRDPGRESWSRCRQRPRQTQRSRRSCSRRAVTAPASIAPTTAPTSGGPSSGTFGPRPGPQGAGARLSWIWPVPRSG